jgi:hypothetical protein
MTHRTRRTDLAPPFSRAALDEGSGVRESVPPLASTRRKSDPQLSLDQRLEIKLGHARALLAKLEPRDARARLLHIAMLCRDEALLDGIVAELSLPAHRSHRSR